MQEDKKDTIDFNQLPEDVQSTTASYLSAHDLFNLSLATKSYHTFFSPLLSVPKFLYHVVRGEYSEVESMLKEDINLVSKRSQVTDCSGRTFGCISAFEYVLWAMDKHMWLLMLEYIPKNKEGNKLLETLYSQYNKVCTVGVTYTLNKKTVTEKHFDFENTIIKELEIHVDSINHGDTNWKKINKQWREGVGGAQKLFPMHMVYQYCAMNSFLNDGQFTGRPASCRIVHNFEHKQSRDWFQSGIGVHFAIYKPINDGFDDSACAYSSCKGSMIQSCIKKNLASIKALYNERMKAFVQLEKSMQVNYCSSIFEFEVACKKQNGLQDGFCFLHPF